MSIMISLKVAVLFLMVGRSSGASCSLEKDDCTTLVGHGSKCREDGLCTVPNLEAGCLQAMIPEWTRKRVCNSEDPRNAHELGLCEDTELPYTEIRIFGGNWVSRVYQTWVLQILLAEVLGVPTSIEGGVPEATLNFYDSSQPLNMGTHGMPDNEHLAFQTGNAIGDCTLANRDPQNYQACAHVMLEMWNSGLDSMTAPVYSGAFEAPTSGGMLGREAVFITKFTLEHDPSFGNYLGLRGEARRELLAAKFLRPTRWKDYCEQVSTDNCTSEDDGVAKGYPLDPEEANRFFVDGFYTGHFRKTEENDCTLNNETFKCTGHIADYPCGWSSFLEAQMHHLGIALQSSGDEPYARGYTYQEMGDMWHAANATKSNMMHYYWTPEPLHQKFMGTDAEMIPVTFPATTQECLDNHVAIEDLCDPSLDVRIGSPLGVCEAPISSLMKLLVSNLQQLSKDPKAPEATHSPAYDATRLFQFSEYQLGEITQYVEQEPSPRLAVCRWAAENMDYLQSFVPQSYPRVIQVVMNDVLSYITTAIGCFVTLVVLLTAFKIYQHREAHLIKIAQIEFLYFLLAGSLMISVGAIMTGLQPHTATCIASTWLINVGYTLELIPLIVKVWAICSIMAAAERMQAAVFSRGKLYGAVTIILVLIVLYLSVWTMVDHPKQQAEYILAGEEEDTGKTVIHKSYYCSSESNMWNFIAVAWNVILLLCASVLAFQMRGAHAVLNESGTLAVLVYSHFFFVVFRVVTFLLSGRVEENILMQVRSLIYSVDTIATVLIYFAPKLWSINADKQSNQIVFSTMAPDVSRKRFSVWKSKMHQTKEFGNLQSIMEANVEQLDPTVRITSTEHESRQLAFTEYEDGNEVIDCRTARQIREDMKLKQCARSGVRIGAVHVGGSRCDEREDEALDDNNNTLADQDSKELRKMLQERESVWTRDDSRQRLQVGDIRSTSRAMINNDSLPGRYTEAPPIPPALPIRSVTSASTRRGRNSRVARSITSAEEEDRVMRKILEERASRQSGKARPLSRAVTAPVPSRQTAKPSSSNPQVEETGTTQADSNLERPEEKEGGTPVSEVSSSIPRQEDLWRDEGEDSQGSIDDQEDCSLLDDIELMSLESHEDTKDAFNLQNTSASDTPPKKYTKVNGVAQLNPAWKIWRSEHPGSEEEEEENDEDDSDRS